MSLSHITVMCIYFSTRLRLYKSMACCCIGVALLELGLDPELELAEGCVPQAVGTKGARGGRAAGGRMGRMGPCTLLGMTFGCAMKSNSGRGVRIVSRSLVGAAIFLGFAPLSMLAGACGTNTSRCSHPTLRVPLPLHSDPLLLLKPARSAVVSRLLEKGWWPWTGGTS